MARRVVVVAAVVVAVMVGSAVAVGVSIRPPAVAHPRHPDGPANALRVEPVIVPHDARADELPQPAAGLSAQLEPPAAQYEPPRQLRVAVADDGAVEAVEIAGTGDGVAVQEASVADGGGERLAERNVTVDGVRQRFLMNGQEYSAFVPTDAPVDDVRPYIVPVCFAANLTTPHCRAVIERARKLINRKRGVDSAPRAADSVDVVSAVKVYTGRQYWEALCPELHVNDDRWSSDAWHSYHVGSTEEELQYVEEAMLRDGYFRLNGRQWGLPVPHAALARCVERLRVNGWPGIFGFMFDEFWMLSRRLHGVVQHILGDDAVAMPDMWVFNIHPVTGEPRGWPPHRDRPDVRPWMPDDTASSINFWVPLTEATPLNGCMYILPRQFDPRRPEENGALKSGDTRDAISSKQLPFLRALPASPGDVLGWDGWVLHWGSVASAHGTDGPRISVAVEYQRHPKEHPPMNQPLMPLDLVPAPDLRLALACKQVRNYAHIREATPVWLERFCNAVDAGLAEAGLHPLPSHIVTAESK